MNSLMIILIILLILIYFWYVVIVRKKNQVMESLSGIDVQLTKRYNLIPNILKIAKNFMKHETDLITEITALREKLPKDYQHDNKEAVSDHFKMHDKIHKKMNNILLQVENYPELKSEQAMLQAQTTYNEVEEHISAARRFYNAATTELNNSIQIFPGNIIAKLANAQVMPFYQANEEQTKTIDAAEILE